MKRGRDEAIWLLVLVVAIAAGKRTRGTAPARSSPAPSTPPAVASDLWSEATMRIFVDEMSHVPIDPWLVLRGIAAASNFAPDTYLGSNTGLLMVRRSDLSDLGYPGVPAFEELNAEHQLPWIARVIAYRTANTGGVAPTSVGDLAVLLMPANPTITEIIRNEAERRAAERVSGSMYQYHAALLQRVLEAQP